MRPINSAVALVVLAVSLCLPAAAAAQSLTAWWDPSPPQDQVTSFDICIGTASLTCDIAQASVPGTQTSYSFTPVEGLLHFVAVRAVNASGLSPYSSEVSVSIPSLTQPSTQSSTLNQAIAPVTLQVTDPDHSALQFSHTGLPTGLTLDPAKGVVSGTPTVQGTFNVTVMVSDQFWSSARSFVWTVGDGSLPTVAITSHTNGQTLPSANVTIAGTATDGGTGDSGILFVTVNGQAASGGTVTGSGVANWSRNLTLPKSGANVVTIEAEDGSTNRRIVSITLNVPSPDAAAPVVAITSHTNGQSVTTSTATIAGTASDATTGGSGIVSVTVNGQAATGGTASGTGTANWTRTLSLAPGANVFTVVATDGAGNQRLTQITVNRVAADTAPPSIGISSHTNGQTVTTSSITLRGTASDSAWGGNGVASVTVNGQAAAGGTVSGSSTANWSRTLSLSAGANTITVVATDGVGNTRTTQISLVASFPVPPATGAALSTSLPSSQPAGTAVTFTASASGGTAPYEYRWFMRVDNGLWQSITGWTTTATYTVNGSSAGTYEVLIWARSAGNTVDAAQASAQRAFVFFVPTSSASTPPPTTSSSTTTSNTTTNTASASTSTSSASPGTPASSAWLTASVVSGQPVGTSVTFTANASGGVAPYQYRWYIRQDNGPWQSVTGWSTNANYTLRPGTPGTFDILIWARSAGATKDEPQATGQRMFIFTAPVATATAPPPAPAPAPVSAPAPAPAPAPTVSGTSIPVSSTSLTMTLPSVPVVGRTVTFTAASTGGRAPYQYRWWVRRDGGPWTQMLGWTSQSTFFFTPTIAGIYDVAVWARSAGSSIDAPEAYAERRYQAAP